MYFGEQYNILFFAFLISHFLVLAHLFSLGYNAGLSSFLSPKHYLAWALPFLSLKPINLLLLFSSSVLLSTIFLYPSNYTSKP